MYQERTYRDWIADTGLTACTVAEGESDCLILGQMDLETRAREFLLQVRSELLAYMDKDPGFATTRSPHPILNNAPLIARRMAKAAELFDVGPMAAVAGAIAECLGEQLLAYSDQVVVENGGDIYAASHSPLAFSLYAGEHSPFTGRLRFTLCDWSGPVGLCTSSGTVGHSHSEGRADAVCVVADDCAIADAAATALCNHIQRTDQLKEVIDRAAECDTIQGILAAKGDKLGMWGRIRILPSANEEQT